MENVALSHPQKPLQIEWSQNVHVVNVQWFLKVLVDCIEESLPDHRMLNFVFLIMLLVHVAVVGGVLH